MLTISPDLPIPTIPAIADALKWYRERLADLQRIQGERPTPKQRADAVAADREAAADAVEQGEPLPKPVNVEEYEQRVKDHERTRDAAQLAVQRAEGRLRAVIDTHRAEWLRAVTAQRDTALEDFERAVESLGAVANDLARAYGMVAYVKKAPDGRLWRASLDTDLKQANNSPFSTFEIVASLQRMADRLANPPAPKPPVYLPLTAVTR